MAIQLISVAKRPNAETPWIPAELNIDRGWYINDQHYIDTWHEKGRMLSSSTTYSDDQLTLTLIREFSDWQALDDFISDTDLTDVRLKRNAYHEQMGIEIVNIETKEV